ncbi:MAG: hypothetical protein HOP08_14065 [Cyclobacteriaceae bacterium]|nr:hypothetical protein [Cyclobacteriaceae bacterium]
MISAPVFRKIVKRILKIAAWTIASVFLLLVAVIIFIRIPAIQNQIVQRAISFLEGKIGTTVSLESITISFPKKIVLSKLYVQDQSLDTLLFASTLSVDVDMWGLMDKRIELNDVFLEGINANVRRNAKDSSFNFDYIPKAFASTDSTVSDTTTSVAWQFSIETLEINRASLSYQDPLSGDSIRFQIGTMEVDIDEFDLNTLSFDANSISLADSRILIHQSLKVSRVETVDSVSQSESSLNIDFEKIRLEKIDLHYVNSSSHENIALLLGVLDIESNEINLRNKVIDLDHIELKETSLIFQTQKSTEAQSVQSNLESSSSPLDIPWKLKLSELKLADNTIQYDVINLPVTNKYLDFNHLRLSFVNIKAEDIEFKNDNVKINLVSTSFRERSGFSIESFRTNLSLTDQQLDINDFLFQSGNSSISLRGNASFQSLASLSDHYDEAQVKFDVRPSTVSMKDLHFFLGSTLDSLPFRFPIGSKIDFNTNIKGSVKDLTVNQLQVRTLDSTWLSLHGNFKGLPEVKTTRMDVSLDRFYITGADAQIILPDTLLPDSIRLPEWIELKAKMKGTINAPQVASTLLTDLGRIDLDGKFDFNDTPVYDAHLKIKEFNIGKILRQDSTMGVVDLNADLKGSGVKMDELNAAIDLIVNKFQFNDYEYRDFKLKGSVNKYLFSGNASLKDKNLDLELNGDLDYKEKMYKLILVVANADFQALHLSKDPLKARATIDVNLVTSDFKVINGKIDIRKFAIFNGKKLYMVDSLLVASIDQKGTSNFTVRSDIVTGDFKGTFNLFSLPVVLRQHFNQYFSLQDEKIKPFKEPTNFQFDLVIKNTDLLTEIIFPELSSFTPGKISGYFNSETDSMRLEANLSKIKYSTTGLDTLELRVVSNKKNLKYRVRLKNITIDTIHVDDFQLIGRIEHDSIHTSLQILDSVAQKKYVLGGIIKSQGDKFRFHFMPYLVMLNYVYWDVPDDNYLDFGSGQIVANNFNIFSEKQKISLITDQKASTIALEFENLQLANFTRIIAGTVPASGILDGNFKVTTVQQGNFNSKLYIHDLTILGKPWGEVTFTVDHVKDRYNLEMLVKSEKTNFRTTGYYISKPTDSEFNLEANFSPLDLKTVEPFTFGKFQDMKGDIVGTLTITGTTAKPSIRGDLNFKDASFIAKDLNSAFTLQNEKISFQSSGISFNNFTIKDEKGQEAVIRGSILTKEYKDFDFNLRVTSANFQILNTPEDNSKPFYGVARINTDIKLTGNVNQPVGVMKASFSDDTNVTYVVPQSEKTILEQKDIIQFTDRDAVNDPFLATIHLEDTVRSEEIIKGIDLTANLELRGKETLNIVIDPITGDKLSVQGNSTLILTRSPAGDMSLSGRYEVTKGTYNFSFYKLVKREFTIEKGGSISWSGDPLKADLDIRASYTVETSPVELISNQVSGTDATSFKQVLPFLVYLNIKGQILTPQISFSLDMPDNKKNAFGGAIYSKLQDINTRESDLNKQVFALLILKRFIADNPLENSSNTGIANTTRQSVSRILSDQLNRLAENVKGVQLNLDIKSSEDYNAGQAQGQTKVQLGVTKNLLNDRLVVKLSGNVDIEGQNTNAKGDATDYIGDLALEYKITEDGRLRITGFRNSNYDMISGELTETGAGLIFIKDYNTLKELFKPNAKIK